LATPAVVVIAFNRPAALERLLAGLRRAHYPAGAQIPLVVSIDYDGSAANQAVRDLAQRADWPHGPKTVIAARERRGLVAHAFFAWGLAETYESVIVLEDDLGVAPGYYAYAAQALAAYEHDPRIAGVSLYGLWFNGFTHTPFVPLPDDGDVFFAAVPFFQGLAWTRGQWARFAAWRAQVGAAARPQPGDPVHPLFQRFPDTDWYPILAKYVAVTGQWVVYPRVGVCAGLGEAGTHFARATAFFQTPLQRFERRYRLPALDDSAAVYDAFFEIQPDRLNRLTDVLAGVEYAVDLYAAKRPADLVAPFVLTTRPWRRARRTFGRVLWPMEANVIEAVPGAEIALCRPADLEWGAWADLRARQRAERYFARGRTPSLRQALLFRLAAWLDRRR